MINTVIAYGCSNTYGDEAIADYNLNVNCEDNIYFSYPWYIAEQLQCNVTNYFNYAKVGMSNQEIATKVMDTLHNHDPETTLVLVGWTDDNRLPITTQTEYSYFTLKRLYNSLSWKLKTQIIKKYKQLQSKDKLTNNITVAQSLVRLVYLKALGLSELICKHGPINTDYYENKIAPFFSDDFILGIEKHIFNTENNTNANMLYKKAVDSYLTENKFAYFMFTTKYISDRKFLNFINTNNYYDWTEHDNFISIIHEYGTKYGMSVSNTHMKCSAHKKLAEHLLTIMKARGIVNE